MSESSSGFSVSVIIPLFNKEEAIAETIGSVFRETRLPDELIVIDDGSTDGSVATVRRLFSSADTGVACRLVAQENSGVSAARNLGAKEARSRYIAFLDADDEWLPGYLEEVEKLAVAFPSATVITTGQATPRNDGSLELEPSCLPNDHFGPLSRPLALYRKGR